MCAKYVPICQSKPLNGVMDLHLENHFPRSFFFHKVPFGHVNESPLENLCPVALLLRFPRLSGYQFK